MASQERRDRGGYLWGMGQGQGMASTGEHHFLGVWQPGQDEQLGGLGQGNQYW